jgi:hypothetical protein
MHSTRRACAGAAPCCMPDIHCAGRSLRRTTAVAAFSRHAFAQMLDAQRRVFSAVRAATGAAIAAAQMLLQNLLS